MYKCEIIADSLSPQGDRLTSFLVTYPRIIHAEMLRHRMFSRNVASSRAIPFSKMVKDVEENPFVPIAWQKAHKGMQGTEYVTRPEEIQSKVWSWLGARNYAVDHAKELNEWEVTKQLCNRLLEPFIWTTELITTGEEGLMNFFELRCPRYKTEFGTFYSKKDTHYAELDITQRNPNTDIMDYPHVDDTIGWLILNESQAEIHIQKIAEMMWDSYNESNPKQLQSGDWHIPFGDNIDLVEVAKLPIKLNPENTTVNTIKVRISTARCARLSYQTLGDNPKIDYEADIKLHDRLLADNHMSPFEHCAKAMSDEEYLSSFKGQRYTTEELYDEGFGWCNNFRGFIQYRYLIEKQ